MNSNWFTLRKKSYNLMNWEPLTKLGNILNYFLTLLDQNPNFKSPIGPLILNGNTVINPVETTEAFKCLFESTYSPPIYENLDVKPLVCKAGWRRLENNKFTEDDIKNPIHEISPNSSAVSDDISPILLRRCSDELKSQFTFCGGNLLIMGNYL